MASRRPRLLATASVLLVVALGLFAGLILHNRADQRNNLEGRFKAAAKVTAALTESVFGSSVGQAAQRNTKDFGGTTVDVAKLQRRVAHDHLLYGVILDANGKTLAQTPGIPVDITKRLATRPDDVSRVLEGTQPYWITGFVAPDTLEYASVFLTPTGERRVIVEGFPAKLISAFLTGYLAKVPSLTPQQNYVLDAQNRVIAASPTGTVGETVQTDAPDRKTATAAVGGTEWTVLLSRKASDVYAGFGVGSQWIIFVAFALAGLGMVVLLSRVARSESRLADANDKLARSFEQLERTNDELIRSNGELEEFASVASHDLQEPLRKVQFFGDQLERKYAENLPEEAKDHLQRMRSAAGRMSTLIDDVLRFSRVTTQARPNQRVDLTALTHDVVADLDALILETGGKVIVGNLPTVEADPIQMRQLLQNLVANALKFHRPDVSPLVNVRQQEATKPGFVAFAVSDNGIGFEPQYEERIFRVFERLHPRNVFAGTGIGLAVCRKIAERAGGTITATSALGHGATFTIELPAVPSTPASSPAEPREPAHA
jgi:signal transduction histidine kinase